MAQATPSLSPKLIQEKIQRHRYAVLTLAHQSAQKAVKRQLRAQGVRLWDVTAKDISIQARAWLEVHREELIAEAEHAIATYPGFGRWRLPDCAELSTAAQTQSPPKSTTSVVQNSSANWRADQ
jgi:hypothetical protein